MPRANSNAPGFQGEGGVQVGQGVPPRDRRAATSPWAGSARVVRTGDTFLPAFRTSRRARASTIAGMRWGAVLTIVVVIGVGCLFALRSKERGAHAAGAAPMASAATLTTASSESAHAPPSARASSATPKGAPADSDETRHHDRAARDDMRRRIYEAFGAPVPAAGGSEPAPSAAEARPLDEDYIQRHLREDFVPMGRECYQERAAKKPDLEGELVMVLHVVGDEKVGGIVESTEIEDGGTLTDPDVLDCLQNSMAAVAMPPPKQGGSTTIKVPMRFLEHPPGEARR